jgi:hypothetical protein
VPPRRPRKAAHDPIGGLLPLVIDACSSGRQRASTAEAQKKHREVHDPGWCYRAEKKQWMEKKPSSGCVRKE